MEENSKCKDCKTWEEEMYWTHFSSLRFFLTLPSDFHHHLVLPQKFASHMKVQLPDRVSLKAPSGALWTVDVLKSDDIIFVGNEWKDFVKANNVKENSLLMFKYDRTSSFEVLMFDQESSCEREDSYFRKKCRLSMSDHDDQNTEITREASSTELIQNVNEEDLAFAGSKKFGIDDGKEGCSGTKADTQFKNSLNKSNVATGLSNNTVVLIPSDSSEDSHMSKGQSENWAARDAAAEDSSPISKRDLINHENEDIIQRIDHSYKSKDQSNRSPRMNGNNNELNMTMGKELITYENSENFPVTDCSHRVKGQVDKEQKASGTVKEVTPISWQAPDDRERFPEESHSQTFDGESGRIKKGFHDSLKKLVFKKVSRKKNCSSKRRLNRGPVIERAKQRASQKETENSFTAIMRPTSVYRRFFMNIPCNWPHKHLLQRNEDVILRVGQKTWVTTFGYYGKGRGLYNGWRIFVLDNNLKELDVLVFTPVNLKVGAVMVLDVEIFRVV